MSHEIRYFTYKETVDKKSVQRECDHYAAMEDWQEGCSGLFRPIRWLDFSICEDYDAAMRTIQNLDRHDYDQLAVKYYEYEQNESGKKKIQALKDACNEAYKAFRAKDEVLYVNTVKSAFVGCKKCGSKLARDSLRSNFCPVCRADLRSDTTKTAIASAKKKWENAQKKIEDAEKANRGKKKVMWLVKIEFHT